VNISPTQVEDRAWRVETDLLGDRRVPAEAYYGIQTLRAKENFALTPLRLEHFPSLIRAMAMVKKAAARANATLGQLEPPVAVAIEEACDDIVAGRLHDQFIVDMIQGGAGTSTNMNANEVIANRALEILGMPRGHYEVVHPNNHVNLSQSTNDAYPTAIRLAILIDRRKLIAEMTLLSDEFGRKSIEFQDVLKVGRTQLQDAVPMTMGQEFAAFQGAILKDIASMEDASRALCEVNLGGTAIGTGINSDPRFGPEAARELTAISGVEFRLAADRIEATTDMGDFVSFSAALKRYAVKLSKICNDLRLLSSGPTAGLGEINLPPVQPGSSIMPGKVNPVIPEAVNQVAYQVIGNDLAVTLAAEAGQLQLNAMEPVIVLNTLQSIDMLGKATNMLGSRCVAQISVNREHCRSILDRSLCTLAALNPHLGYDRASYVARKTRESGQSAAEIVLANKWMSSEKISKILDPTNVANAIKRGRVPL
tara:strand:+ start:6679 stop:8121 length:1443 start_codon:yes stop_codon:yes gene_type:complete